MGSSNTLKYGGKNLDPENWKVLHPNGKHMFTCGGKKARWYLERELATQIGDFEIKFTFEPNGDGFDENEVFGRSMREAQCVVTGVKDELQRHHIIPYCYRTHFPERYKAKNHHDVVLINSKEHSDYEQEATKFKDALAEKYGIKTIGEYNKAYSQMLREFNRDNTLVLSKLGAIFKGYGNLSNDMVQNNLKFVSEKINVSYEFLKECNYLQIYKLHSKLSELYTNDLQNFKARHSKYYDHGWHLVKKLDSDGKIEEFVKLWRTHFIETVNPQYMPEGWSINFRIKTRT